MICVGIDVAKDKHDCFILSSEGEVLADVFTIQNNAERFDTLLQTIRRCVCPGDKIKVGLEATGHYKMCIRDRVYHEPLMNAPNVEFCWNSTVSALLHESRLTGLRLKDVNTGAERDLACDGVFISVGRAPATELFQGELALDKSGYIIADESTRTNLPGVFAAGDVRTKALRQVVTAVSDGAVAVHYAEEYLAENR